jgi:hypothetical protein
MDIRAKLFRRSNAYRTLFAGDAHKDQTAVVLRDLARYCYAGKATLKVSPVTGQADPIAMAFAEGRRDVFNRIMAMCNLTQSQIDNIANTRGHDD